MTELQKWLQLIRDGNMVAFEALYDEMKRPLFTIILRIMQNRQLAEDVLQELFLKLYSSPPEPSVNPRAYLCQMARNLTIDSARCQKQHSDLEQENAFHSPLDDLSQILDIEDAIQALPQRELQIFTLRHKGELKFQEIATIMGMPLGTVFWAYQKAIEQLKITLGGAL